MADDEYYDDDEQAPEDDYAAAGEAVARALGGGADPEAIAGLAAGFMQEGYDEAGSLEAAANWYDHSDCEDEMQAAAKIGQREGWE